MNRTRGGGMRGFARKQTASVKDRIGFVARRGVSNNPARPQLRRTATQLIQQQLVGSGPTRRSIRGRLGGSTGTTRILDARQKINLNRIQTGRISDAREKLEAKRKQQGVVSGKIKNLKITTPMAPMASGFFSSGNRPTSHSAGYFASDPPDFGNGSLGPPMNSGGLFRSAMGELMNPEQRMGGMAAPIYGHGQSNTSGRSLSPGMFLTRTINNPAAAPAAGGMNYGFDQRPPSSGVAKVAPNPQYRGYSNRRLTSHSHSQPMDEDEPISHPRHLSSSMQARLDASNAEVRYKIQVSNLQSSVTSDDIVELFSDIGQLVSAKMTSQGHAEVTYAKKSDALKAVEAYHNRLLDGSPMRVFMEPTSSTTTLKSAAGSSIKLPKASSSIKIQPDISAIHKVLFNPSSSGTRGLFKAGQGQ